ncbi:hypothetical protein BGV68_04550 [Burkholderia ubonensis]|nr:hypothetical protein BGV68_04550 [Burkholderia ubonensis]
MTYLTNNPAAQVVGGIGPSYLLSQLPSDLQPSSVPFYYNPFDENQALETAALQRLGKASFIDGLTYDNKYQATVVDQEKYVLYANAIDYAKAHDLKIGVALSSEQLASLDKPMLWYVEQAVPQPGCTATGGAVCPTVEALMPQVYLPQGYASIGTEGVISGHDVTLAFHDASRIDDITNTGSITATGTLSTPGARITNLERSVDIGSNYADAGDDGYTRTSGTVLQQGGFMSAANFANNAAMINNIGGQIQKLGADGSIDQAGTAAELAQLKSQLGGNFQQSTVSNHLNSEYQSDGHTGGMAMVFQAAILVAMSIASAGAGAALIGATAGTMGAAVANAAFSAVLSSYMSQGLSGHFSLTGMVESVATAVVTAGVTNGITYDSATNSLGVASWSQNLNNLGDGVKTLGQLAGTAPVAGTTISQATTSLADTLPQQALAIGAESVLQAGAQTAFGQGAFLTNLRNDAVSNVAAAAANGIGDAFNGQAGSLGSPSDPAYVLAHAVLGCASSAAQGNGCAGGAIGGAISAGLNPIIDANGNIPPAALMSIETVVSGSVAGALGFNVQGAMTAAQNETLNNYLNHVQTANLVASLKSCAPGDTACINHVTASYQSISQQQQQQAKNCSSVTDCATIKNDTLSGYGISASDAQSYCQGSANCVSFLTGLGNQDVAAKSIATTNWNDISNAVYMQNAQQALVSSGFSPTTAAVLSAATPQDAAGATEALTGSGSSSTKSGVSQADLNALAENGVKFTPQNVVATGTTPNGQVVFLETGNSSAGLQHIIDGHAADFANIGVSQAQIPSVVMQAVTEGHIVGYQGSGTGRPIYQTTINGQTQRIAVTVGSNGFIVGANPAGRSK